MVKADVASDAAVDSLRFNFQVTLPVPKLNSLQRRTALFTYNNFHDRDPGAVIPMLENLGWETLEQQSAKARAVLMYKITNNLVDIPLTNMCHINYIGTCMVGATSDAKENFEKLIYPVSLPVYPVAILLHGFRRLFVVLYSGYLKFTKNRQKPEVLYKSDNYLIVNKPFDISVNNIETHQYTLADNLKANFPDLVDKSCTHYFRFAHRLDYPTSGVLCLSLNAKAAAKAGNKFQKKQVIKHYLALVSGHLSEPNILVDVPIGRDSSVDYKHKMCTCMHPACEKPRSATTLIILLEHGTYSGMATSKVVMIPYTGRTHQLRVHCNLIGHTIVGDYTYSNEKDTIPYRMMLHSYKLYIPVQSEPLDIISEDPFTSQIDSNWVPYKIINTYADAVKEEWTLQKVQNKNICNLTYHIMTLDDDR